MNILIAGCGYVGRALGSVLVSRGHRVWGLCRSDASLDKVRAAGIEPFRADLRDPQTLRRLPPVDAVVACQAPSRSESSNRSVSVYRQTYLDATGDLIRALKPVTHVRFVLVSSTSVYGARAGGWVDASTRIDVAALDEDAAVLRQTEQLVLAAPMKGMVVRLSGIYGPGRNRADAIRSGAFRPDAGPAYTNRIHRDDAAAAIALVLEDGRPGEVYLATDDVPAAQSEFYGWLCGRLGVEPPRPPQSAAAAHKAFDDSKRCSNEKLKRLGWTPKYPSYREGYGELLSGCQKIA